MLITAADCGRNTVQGWRMVALAALVAGVCSCHSGVGKPAAPDAVAETKPPVVARREPPVGASPAPKAAATKTQASKPPAELLDKLNYEEEGGSRDATYEVWIHVTRRGGAVSKAVVGALNERNKLAGEPVYSDAHGDALLLLEKGRYRIVSQRHGAKGQAEATVNGPLQLGITLGK